MRDTRVHDYSCEGILVKITIIHFVGNIFINSYTTVYNVFWQLQLSTS
jgi:hypothetical protein